MLPQTDFFGKWRRIRARLRPLFAILLVGLVSTAVILSALSQSQTSNYLPLVFKDGVPGTPVPPCDVAFVNEPQAGNSHVLVSDDVGRIVSMVNLTTGETMGTDRAEAVDGYDCSGLADYAPPYQLSGPLTLGHEVQAQSDDGGEDTAVVTFNLSATPPAPGLIAAAVLTTPTPSATPMSPDLQIVGPPQLVSTPPIIAYQPVQFEGDVIAGQNYVAITGEVGSIVTIVDLTDGSQPIGESPLFGPLPGYACPGFATIPIDPAELILGHVPAAISSDGTTDTTIVLGVPPTPTPGPLCPVHFEGYVIEGQNYVAITGEVGSMVTIVDLTEGGQVIGESPLFGPLPGHGCPGFATIPIDPAELIIGHVLAAISSDGTTATIIVLGAPPTATPTPTIMSGSRTP